MSIFSKFGRIFKSKEPEENKELESIGEQEQQGDEDELTHHLKQIVDSTYEMEDLKREYELVTSYFSDIQKIEQMPENQRSALEDDARKILQLEANRKTLQNAPKRLAADRYKLLLRLEPEVPDAISRLEELEDMRGKIKRDLEYLEGEKGALQYEEEELQQKQGTIRNIAIILGVLAVLSVVTFLAVNIQFGVDLTVAGAVIAILVILVEFFLVVAHYRTDAERKLTYQKHNRAIVLQNKVKIKWLNNTNSLDYLYAKFEVNTEKELRYNWEQYQLMQEEEKQYRQSSGDLKVYQDELIMNLQNAGVYDCTVWLQQVEAFVD